METNVNYTVVGAFVIILTVVMIMAMIWLTSGLSIEHYTTYQVNMKESVSGLAPDSPVEFNGVNVGTVRSIDLNTQNPQLVEVLLRIKTSTPITKATRAMLNVRGLTGVAYIALKNQGTDTLPLKAEKGEPYPVISTAPSLLVRIDTALSKLSMNFQTISNAIGALLDKNNLAEFRGILHNMNRFSDTLAANSQQFNLIIENTARASQQLSPLLQMLQLQTLPTADDMLTNLSGVSRNLTEISAEVQQNPAVLVRGRGPQPLGPGEK